MTTRHRTFITHYLSNGYNATRATIAAGYSPNGARVQGHRLKKRPEIAALIEAHREEERKKWERKMLLLERSRTLSGINRKTSRIIRLIFMERIREIDKQLKEC